MKSISDLGAAQKPRRAIVLHVLTLPLLVLAVVCFLVTGSVDCPFAMAADDATDSVAGSPDSSGQPRQTTGRIVAIRPVETTAEMARFIIELDGGLPPKTSVIEGQRPRIVCDFFGVRLAKGISEKIPVADTIVEKIRIGIHRKPKAKVRIVFDLLPDRNYSVEQFFFEKEATYALTIKLQS